MNMNSFLPSNFLGILELLFVSFFFACVALLYLNTCIIQVRCFMGCEKIEIEQKHKKWQQKKKKSCVYTHGVTNWYCVVNTLNGICMCTTGDDDNTETLSHFLFSSMVFNSY